MMIGHGMLSRRWPRAPHGLIDAIVAAAPSVLDKHKINTPLRLAHFMAQVSHECGGGTITEENLRYSAKRMTQVWPSRFRTIEAAAPYANNPKALANKVYNGRMGNRPGTDDGWNYRGRGLIQITGRDGYAQVGKVAGLDLVSHPHLANDPAHALAVAAAFWSWKKLNPVADTDNLRAVTRIVNGGYNGLPDRQAWLARWKDELAGPDVRAFLATTAAPRAARPLLVRGSKGPAVETLQTLLRIDVDGRFGPKTEAAVKAFQRQNGLIAHGKVDAGTWAALS